ncbi:MAG: 6-bladed beta-propeller, partial [Acidobacteria bacterium]
MKRNRWLWAAIGIAGLGVFLFLLVQERQRPSSSAVADTLFSTSEETKPPQEKETNVSFYQEVPIFDGFGFDYPQYVRRDDEGNYYVMDQNNHRICVFDPSMRFKFQIGHLGQGPEDLNHPTGYALDSHGRLYIKDVGNLRIQIFDKTGHHVGGFRSPLKSPDIAVNSRGEIFLNHATRGHLISVYSREGELLRQFGDLMSLSHAYPGHADDERYRVPLSRVVMAMDGQDNLYVAYVFAPIIQKYDPAGKLLWERRLEGPLIDVLTKSFWQELEPNPATEKFEPDTVMNMDGIQMAVICQGIALDKTTTRVFLLLGAADIIYVADSAGRKLRLLSPKKLRNSL